ncbi:MAG: metalloregulator ArsR/SmtB family transcription factor [Verrucomicrobiota bacterium]
MSSTLNSLKLLSDPTRLRLFLLLSEEALSVAELQAILAMGQSRISTQLGLLRRGGLVRLHKDGKRSLYEPVPPQSEAEAGLRRICEAAALELEEAEPDRRALDLVRQHRADAARDYFDRLAGKFGKGYIPGRSWKSLAETLLQLLAPLRIADLGAGEGTLSQLMAQKATEVIAIDNSEKMVAFGKETAAKNGFQNLRYLLGDLESTPIEDETVDLALFSQALHHAAHPGGAVKEAFRIVRPGGRVVILDLLKHNFEEARELYADLWLGFAEVDLHRFLSDAGFVDLHLTVVDREPEYPHFQTVLAIGRKPE